MPATAPTPARYWSATRDDYGRPNRILRDARMHELAVLVTLPRSYFEKYGHRYLVTDRRNIAYAERRETRYFAKRGEAIAYAEATYTA